MDYAYSILRKRQVNLMTLINAIEEVSNQNENLKVVLKDYKDKFGEVSLAMEIIEEEMLRNKYTKIDLS